MLISRLIGLLSAWMGNMKKVHDVNFGLLSRDIDWLDTLAYILEDTPNAVVRALIYCAYTGKQLNKMDLRDFTEEQLEQAMTIRQADRSV